MQFEHEPEPAEWSDDFRYDACEWLLSENFEAKRELLSYPNPEGLHPVEVGWRDFGRQVLMMKEHCFCESTWLPLPQGGWVKCPWCNHD